MADGPTRRSFLLLGLAPLATAARAATPERAPQIWYRGASADPGSLDPHKTSTVIEGDILKIELDTVFGPGPGALRPGLAFSPEPARVVGNLPYYITSDILLRLLEYHRYFSTIVIMVQKEVADRISAAPGTRDYGMLSATSQMYAHVENLFTLPPQAFNPPPKVYSSVLRLTLDPQQEKLGVTGDGFIDFLRLSFAQKRKTLWNNLKEK